MNSKQRRKHQRQVYKLTMAFANLLNEAADDLESGKISVKDFIKGLE